MASATTVLQNQVTFRVFSPLNCNVDLEEVKVEKPLWGTVESFSFHTSTIV